MELPVGRAGLGAPVALVSEAAVAGPGPPAPLPRQLTSFVGRERELAQVIWELGRRRLVTLCGAGGTGKTRLALKVAERLLAQHPDGVFVVELAEVSDPQLVASCAASAMGVRERPEIGALASLTEALAPVRALVVLDNCEHLVEACARLTLALLQGCPRLRLLATSREPLGVPGEFASRLPSLPTPSTEDDGATPEDLAGYDSVRLFADRARAFQPSFELTAAGAPAVTRICELTEGIPLAIELAAGRLTTLSADQVADQLHDALGVLTGGSRVLAPRQRALRATIDWSYERLAPGERVLFNRLSVFSGLASLEAVRAVCAGPTLPAVEILDTLARLIDKSLVQAEAARRELRYRLLELLRQYAGQKLARAGEADELRARHAAHFAEMAEASYAEPARTQVSVWAQRLGDERSNFRAALAWSLRSDPAMALRLAAGLAWYWHRLSNLAEGRRWLERALGTGAGDPALRARALHGVGQIAYREGDSAAARSFLAEALAIHRELGDEAAAARVLRSLGLLLLALRDHGSATRCLEDALAISGRLGESLDMERATASLAMVAMATGSLDTAHDRMEESATLAREIGDEWGLAASIGALGELALETGDQEAARSHLQASIDSLARLRDAGGIAYRLEGFARLAARSRPERALRLAGAAASVRAGIGAAPVPDWRQRLAEAMARSRRSLSARVAAEAEAQGRRMTIEEAVAYALEVEPAASGHGSRESLAPAWASARSRSAGLSAREWDVLGLVMSGLSSRAIAARLTVSPNTVNKHVASILKKLAARSRAHAIAVVLGLDHDPSPVK